MRLNLKALVPLWAALGFLVRKKTWPDSVQRMMDPSAATEKSYKRDVNTGYSKGSPLLTFTAVNAFLRAHTNWVLTVTFSPPDVVLDSGREKAKSSPSVDNAPKTSSHTESFLMVANLVVWVYLLEARGNTVLGSWKLWGSEE